MSLQKHKFIEIKIEIQSSLKINLRQEFHITINLNFCIYTDSSTLRVSISYSGKTKIQVSFVSLKSIKSAYILYLLRF